MSAGGYKLLVADPARLSLPPLAPGEEVRPSGHRMVRQVGDDLPGMGPMIQLFGTHDIRGRGTHVQPSPHCDPFMMCAAAKMPKGAKPPFCAHPHCGASVATLLFQGGAMMAWDNVGGDEAERVLPGGIYHVDTGAGCVHNETMEPVDVRPRTQPGFDDEPDSVPCAADDDRSSMCQLWWSALDCEAPEGTPLRPVTTQVVLPSQVPRVSHEGGVSVRVLAGSYRGSADACPSVRHPVLLLHVRLSPSADGTLSPLPSDFNGFVWCLEGSATVGGGESGGDGGDGDGSGGAVDITHGPRGLVFTPPGGDALRLRNPSSASRAMLLVALGMPHRKPHYKYVGYGGGLIHRSVAEVEAAMGEYEKDPINYGRAAAQATAKPVDVSGYKLVSGFQDNHGDMMERPPEMVARWTYASPD